MCQCQDTYTKYQVFWTEKPSIPVASMWQCQNTHTKYKDKHKYQAWKYKTQAIKFRLHCFELRAYQFGLHWYLVCIWVFIYILCCTYALLTSMLQIYFLYFRQIFCPPLQMNILILCSIFESKFYVLVRFVALLYRWRFYALWKLICGFAPFSRFYALGIFFALLSTDGCESES